MGLCVSVKHSTQKANIAFILHILYNEQSKLTFVGPSEGDREGPAVGPIEGDFVGDEDGEVVG